MWHGAQRKQKPDAGLAERVAELEAERTAQAERVANLEARIAQVTDEVAENGVQAVEQAPAAGQWNTSPPEPEPKRPGILRRIGRRLMGRTN